MTEFIKTASNFVGTGDDIDNAEVVIAGIPYDVTSSYRHGSEKGPDSAREFSDSIESFSPDRFDDITDHNIADIGNIKLKSDKPEEVIKEVEEMADGFIAKGKKVLYLAGEHLLSFPLVKAYLKKYPDLRFMHFDAHADMRDNYDGNRYTHCTFMRRLSEIMPPKNMFMFGTRSFEKNEMMYMREKMIFCDPKLEHLEDVVETIKKFPVYITIDIDVFDPAAVPGVGNPEAGGIFYNDFIRITNAFENLNNIVGADILELMPNYDTKGASSTLTAKVIREMLLVMANSSKQG